MQAHRTDELLATRVTGREPRLEEAAQSRDTAPRDIPHENAVREPASGSETPRPPPVPRTNARDELREALRSGQTLRRAILLHEVLGPPKAFELE